MSNTVFVVGTGAVENAWVPVTRALQEIAPNLPFTNADLANFWMAKLVALRRSAKAVSAKLRDNHNHLSYVEPAHQELRKAICTHLKHAQESGEIILRKSFRDTFRNSKWGEQKRILTTNWDQLIENSGLTQVEHIHGTISDWTTLYLPSEYAFDSAHEDSTQQQMFIAQDLAIRELWNTRKVCLFGLSLDPLDAELSLIIESGLHEHIDEINICNLKSEEQKLRDRVSLLCRRAANANITFTEVQ